MTSQLERAVHALFPPEGSRVGNVKFFLSGNSRFVTAEQLAEQLNRADAQIRVNHISPTEDIDGDLCS